MHYSCSCPGAQPRKGEGAQQRWQAGVIREAGEGHQHLVAEIVVPPDSDGALPVAVCPSGHAASAESPSCAGEDQGHPFLSPTPHLSGSF